MTDPGRDLRMIPWDERYSLEERPAPAMRSPIKPPAPWKEPAHRDADRRHAELTEWQYQRWAFERDLAERISDMLSRYGCMPEGESETEEAKMPGVDEWRELAILLALKHEEPGFSLTPDVGSPLPTQSKKYAADYARTNAIKMFLNPDPSLRIERSPSLADAARRAHRLLAAQFRAGEIDDAPPAARSLEKMYYKASPADKRALPNWLRRDMRTSTLVRLLLKVAGNVGASRGN